MDRIREERSQDLLIYLALSRFGKRPRSSELPNNQRSDIRAFFLNYRSSCERADELLFSAGKSEVIDAACRSSVVGKQTPEALYFHITALPLYRPS